MNRAASKNNDKRCGTCAHATLPKTPSGRNKRGAAGSCGVPVFMSPLPMAVTAKVNRTAIWPDFGAGCVVWAPIPTPEVKA